MKSGCLKLEAYVVRLFSLDWKYECSSLLQEMAWCQVGAMLFLEPMLINHGLEHNEHISIKYFAGFAHFH